MRRFVALGSLAFAAVLGCGPSKADPEAPARLAEVSFDPTVEDLRALSIDQLAQLQVTSVGKRPIAVSDSPAAIYVITHEDIIRSGAVTLPEILRLAPNLQVFQQSANAFVVTARGFSGNRGDQSFSNLMLVLIDGRSVYNPLFTGVYWDMHDVPPDDIERIEVVSGPGGTLWGANAVNGVINIITRRSQDTQGGFVDYANGTQERILTGQFGGKIGDDLAFRVYARSLTEYDTRTADGAKADDEWSKPQGGFRFDWTPTKADAISLSGDYFEGSEAAQGAPDVQIDGRNIVGRWDHGSTGGGGFDLLAYWDREASSGGGDSGSPFFVDTYDLEAQDSFGLGARQQIVVGAGFRLNRYGLTDTALVWTPDRGALDTSDIFMQDTIALSRRLSLTVGIKLENDPYSGVSPMPNLRLAWKPLDDLLLWAAVSRAVRSPTPFDTDLAEVVGGATLLKGVPDFLPEVLTAYEAGGRLQPTSRSSVSISLYFNDYDDLRNIQATPTTFFPLTWGNGLYGRTWGVEGWADYRWTSWWRVTASLNFLHEDLAYKPGATTLVGLTQDGDDPKHQAQLRSSMDLGRRVSFDADLRYVDALPAPFVPAYVELDSRLAWRLDHHLEISIAGFNLLHPRHQEAPGAYAVPRNVRFELRAGF